MYVPFVLADDLCELSTGTLVEMKQKLEYTAASARLNAIVRNMIVQEAFYRKEEPKELGHVTFENAPHPHLWIVDFGVSSDGLTYADRKQLLEVWLMTERYPHALAEWILESVIMLIEMREANRNNTERSKDEQPELEDFNAPKYRSVDRRARQKIVQGRSCRFEKKLAAKRQRQSWKNWTATLNPKVFNRRLGGERM